MIERAWAKAFAAEWIAAWNSHDLERVLSHYTDDFEMTSPLIIQLMHEPSGTLKGKAAIRTYWQTGLAANPGLHFDLIDMLVGVSSIILYYRTASGRTSAEVVIFNEAKLVMKSIANYGE